MVQLVEQEQLTRPGQGFCWFHVVQCLVQCLVYHVAMYTYCLFVIVVYKGGVVCSLQLKPFRLTHCIVYI